MLGFDKILGGTRSSGANLDSPMSQNVGALCSVCKFCTCGSELHWRRSWRKIRHHKDHPTTISQISHLTSTFPKTKSSWNLPTARSCAAIWACVQDWTSLSRTWHNLLQLWNDVKWYQSFKKLWRMVQINYTCGEKLLQSQAIAGIYIHVHWARSEAEGIHAACDTWRGVPMTTQLRLWNAPNI